MLSDYDDEICLLLNFMYSRCGLIVQLPPGLLISIFHVLKKLTVKHILVLCSNVEFSLIFEMSTSILPTKCSKVLFYLLNKYINTIIINNIFKVFRNEKKINIS